MSLTEKYTTINTDSVIFEHEYGATRKNQLTRWLTGIEMGHTIYVRYSELADDVRESKNSTKLLADTKYNESIHLNVLCAFAYQCYREALAQKNYVQANICFDKALLYSAPRLESMQDASLLYGQTEEFSEVQKHIADFTAFHDYLLLEKTELEQNPAPVLDAAVAAAQPRNELDAAFRSVDKASQLLMNIQNHHRSPKRTLTVETSTAIVTTTSSSCSSSSSKKLINNVNIISLYCGKIKQGDILDESEIEQFNQTCQQVSAHLTSSTSHSNKKIKTVGSLSFLNGNNRVGSTGDLPSACTAAASTN